MSTATDVPATLPCVRCGASLASCNAKRIVSGRHCCDDRCVHANAPVSTTEPAS